MMLICGCDEWAAEQCGVELYNPPDDKIITFVWVYWRYQGQDYTFPWTIKDPRCREIVREHFGIYTRPCNDKGTEWTCVALHVDDIQEWGKTIAEAEIACITAIYEAQKDE